MQDYKLRAFIMPRNRLNRSVIVLTEVGVITSKDYLDVRQALADLESPKRRRGDRHPVQGPDLALEPEACAFRRRPGEILASRKAQSVEYQ